MTDEAFDDPWHLAGKTADFEDEDVEQLWVGELAIAVYRAEGEFYATQDLCTQKMPISPTASSWTASWNVPSIKAVSTSAAERRSAPR